MVHLLPGHKYRDMIDSIKETEFPISVDSIIVTDAEEGTIVGVLNMDICPTSVYLQTLEILPQFRYRGYAKATIQKIFDMYTAIEYISGVVFNDIMDFYKSLDNCTLRPCTDETMCSCDDMFIFKIERADY